MCPRCVQHILPCLLSSQGFLDDRTILNPFRGNCIPLQFLLTEPKLISRLVPPPPPRARLDEDTAGEGAAGRSNHISRFPSPNPFYFSNTRPIRFTSFKTKSRTIGSLWTRRTLNTLDVGAGTLLCVISSEPVSAARALIIFNWLWDLMYCSFSDNQGNWHHCAVWKKKREEENLGEFACLMSNYCSYLFLTEEFFTEMFCFYSNRFLPGL